MPKDPPLPLDPWGLLGLPGQVPPASFLTSANAHQYRLIVRILAEQQAHSLTGVSHADVTRMVHESLPEDQADDLMEAMNLDARLNQLTEWDVVSAWQDQAETEADFLRNRRRYQLTESGAYLFEVATHLESELGQASTAALAAPGMLADHIAVALEALRTTDADAAHRAVADIQNTLKVMAETASIWQSKLAAALGGTPDEGKVIRLLETILAYVDAWGAGVDQYTDPIADNVVILGQVPADVWRRVALARVGATAPDHTIDAVVVELQAVPVTLAQWFCGAWPQARRLRRQMRDAITPVLRSHRTLLAVGGSVSRKADLVRLAHAIEAAPDEATAWDTWATATSLYSARHLTLGAPEVDAPLRTSVWDAPPVPISQRLRTHGHRSLTGRVARMPDLTTARDAARQAAARERADHARAEAEVVQRSGTRLSTWAPLGRMASAFFLELLSAARDGRQPDGTSAGTSDDGRWTVRLTPTDPPAWAVLHTPDGRLALPDALVEIVS